MFAVLTLAILRPITKMSGRHFASVAGKRAMSVPRTPKQLSVFNSILTLGAKASLAMMGQYPGFDQVGLFNPHLVR